MASVRRRTVDACAAMTLAAAALAAAAWSGAADPDRTAALHGVCRELLAGTTEGRQALVGSCWFGPLPALVATLVSWVGGARVSGAALGLAAWGGWALALHHLGRMAAARGVARLAVQAAAAAAIAACGAALDPAAALASWLGILAAGACANWAAAGGLGSLSAFGFALGGLALCGAGFAGWAAAAALALPVATLRRPALRARLPAVLLLGWAPLLYALGVWALLDWLLLGHPLYFVQALFAARVHAWRGWPGAGGPVAVAAGVLALAAGAGAAWKRRADAGMLAGLALAALLWDGLLRAASAYWAAGAAVPLAALATVAALARLTGQAPRPPLADDAPMIAEEADAAVPARGALAVAGVALAVLAAAAVAGGRQACAARGRGAAAAQEAQLCREVEAYVAGRTPYGRIFACGYEGLALLRRQPRGRVLPNMDLHVATVRRAYRGQEIYLLVHRPAGLAAADSVHWRFPRAYQGEIEERAMFSRDFGDWRLFEIVGAPSADQLREWRGRR